MEGSFHPSGTPSHMQWYSPPRQSHVALEGQDATTNPADGSSPSRSFASRRRRILGRLARSGSDPRNASNSHFNADVAEFVPESLLKMPSKRKASSQAKSGKSVQFSSGMNSAYITATDPPIIKSEDISSANYAVLQANAISNTRDLMDSSDDDLDAFELSMLGPTPANNNQPSSVALDQFNTRAKIAEESRKKLEAGRMSSAILVSNESGPLDATVFGGGTQRIRYLPLCPTRSGSGRFEAANYGFLTVLSSHRNFVQRLQQGEAQSNATWPLNELPVELFDLITTHLARDDVKSMRLVNQEFEQKVSRSLFHTSVVPFNTEIYDMMDEERKTVSRVPIPRIKGKGKMKAVSQPVDEEFVGSDTGGLQWQNAMEDKEGKVYKGHGLRVFQGFGPHIKRFGMSFEISEKQLSRPPIKKELDHIESYHGPYDWPSMNYARFASLAGLENTADETSRMKAAFSNLGIVQELALSVDSGLGWLSGPDKSLHGLIFGQPTPVFGTSYKIPDHATQAAIEFWASLQDSQLSFDPLSNLKEAALEHRSLTGIPSDLEGLQSSIYSNTRLWSAVDRSRVSPALNTAPSAFGVLYTTANQQTGDVNHRSSLVPSELNKEQREWLLETQWAQQAFLESYMLAVVDNPTTFITVSTLNIAQLSSRFLPMLAREAFWDALPHVSEVILRVSPDWRNVEKDDAGFVQTVNKYPSEAARVFNREILQGRIAPNKSIKKLHIGWAGGGEQAQGMFARNNHILPAPLTKPDNCTVNSSILGIVFAHVEHLTLSNCWITPPALEGLVKSHSSKALKKLTLHSVSLTAHPKFPANLQGAGAQQFAQAMAAVQAQFANNAQGAAQAPFGFPQAAPIHGNAGIGHLAAAQQMTLWQQQLHLQWHQQLQNGHNNANVNLNALVGPFPQNGFPNGVPNVNNHNNDNQTNSHWTASHREGSWPHLLNTISPGPVFDDYLPPPAPWEEPLPTRLETTLQKIEFKSCGYAKLPNHSGFDQLVLEPHRPDRHSFSQWFRSRHAALKSAMMTTNDRNIGQIIQHIPWREMNALRLAWGLVEGWQDHSKAEEPEFDGYLPGGTGRFSGVVEKGMSLVGWAETSDGMTDTPNGS